VRLVGCYCKNLHSAYITIIHLTKITLQGLTPLLHIQDVLDSYLGLETRCLAFCVLLSAPDKCQDRSLIQAVTNSTCFPIHDSLLILSLEAI